MLKLNMPSLKKEFKKIHQKYQERKGPKIDINKLLIRIGAIIVLISFVLVGAISALNALSPRL